MTRVFPDRNSRAPSAALQGPYLLATTVSGGDLQVYSGEERSALDEVLSSARGARACATCDVGRKSRPLDGCHGP